MPVRLPNVETHFHSKRKYIQLYLGLKVTFELAQVPIVIVSKNTLNNGNRTLPVIIVTGLKDGRDYFHGSDI